MKVKSYPDGSYHGEIDEGGQRTGQGLMEYHSGQQYKGGWLRGQRHGYGVFKTPNQAYRYGMARKEANMFKRKNVLGRTDVWERVYTGNWRMGHEHGIGKEEISNGDYFKGTFNMGKKTGFGLERVGQKFFTGEWDCGVKKDQFFIFALNSGEALEVVYKKGTVTRVRRLNPRLNIKECQQSVGSNRSRKMRVKEETSIRSRTNSRDPRSSNRLVKNQMMKKINEIQRFIQMKSMMNGTKTGAERAGRSQKVLKSRFGSVTGRAKTNSIGKYECSTKDPSKSRIRTESFIYLFMN